MQRPVDYLWDGMVRLPLFWPVMFQGPEAPSFSPRRTSRAMAIPGSWHPEQGVMPLPQILYGDRNRRSRGPAPEHKSHRAPQPAHHPLPRMPRQDHTQAARPPTRVWSTRTCARVRSTQGDAGLLAGRRTPQNKQIATTQSGQRRKLTLVKTLLTYMTRLVCKLCVGAYVYVHTRPDTSSVSREHSVTLLFAVKPKSRDSPKQGKMNFPNSPFFGKLVTNVQSWVHK